MHSSSSPWWLHRVNLLVNFPSYSIFSMWLDETDESTNIDGFVYLRKLVQLHGVLWNDPKSKVSFRRRLTAVLSVSCTALSVSCHRFVFVRIFRKNTVCLSGRTTMRQSFMDFCCPCPPKSGIYDDQNSWNYQKYKNRLYFPNRMYVLFLLDIHHCDSDLNGILKYSYSGWIPSYLMRYLFTFWFSIWNNFNFKQAKKLDFDWWMNRKSDRFGELRLKARRFDWTYDL